MPTSQPGFQLGILPERKIDRRALAASYTFMMAMLLLLINLGMIFPDRLQLRHYQVTELIPLPALKPEQQPEQQPPVKLKPLKIKVVPPAPLFDQPKLIVPHEVHHTPKPEPVEAPKVVMNTFAAPELKMTAANVNPRLLHTGDFSGSSVAPTLKATPQQVQTGGFGDPNGLKGEGKSNAKLYAAQTGSFEMPVGPGQGNGSGGAKGLKGTVASADFGSGIATAGNSHGGTVVTGGFGSEQVVHGGPKIAQADSGPATAPVEITFKPQPVYTDEARNLKLEGEVLLEVTFNANGSLHVNRVVRGLGHGLDEAAINATNKMRFKPALRMGQPVDSTAVVHVLFQLAY
jgi:TonB family protein